MDLKNQTFPPDYGKAVKVLSGAQAREFLIDVKEKLQEESEYLLTHRMSLGVEMQRILFGNGIRWQRDSIENYGFQILKKVLDELGSTQTKSR